MNQDMCIMRKDNCNRDAQWEKENVRQINQRRNAGDSESKTRGKTDAIRFDVFPKQCDWVSN